MHRVALPSFQEVVEGGVREAGGGSSVAIRATNAHLRPAGVRARHFAVLSLAPMILALSTLLSFFGQSAAEEEDGAINQVIDQDTATLVVGGIGAGALPGQVRVGPPIDVEAVASALEADAPPTDNPAGAGFRMLADATGADRLALAGQVGAWRTRAAAERLKQTRLRLTARVLSQYWALTAARHRGGT